MEIKIAPAYDSLHEVCELFKEYTEMLIHENSEFKKYLEIQNYEEELKHLEEKYGPPWGRLYIAWCGEKPAACIGLRKLDSDNCEMKRLYVRPEYRGNQIAGRLIEKIIEDAGEIGYTSMLLDTLPFLQSAVHLYRRYGFYETPCYNESPLDTTIYMKLDLR